LEWYGNQKHQPATWTTQKVYHPIVIPINRLMVDVYGNGNINGNQNPPAT
jgi:hypothetical protein